MVGFLDDSMEAQDQINNSKVATDSQNHTIHMSKNLIQYPNSKVKFKSI